MHATFRHTASKNLNLTYIGTHMVLFYFENFKSACLFTFITSKISCLLTFGNLISCCSPKQYRELWSSGAVCLHFEYSMSAICVQLHTFEINCLFLLGKCSKLEKTANHECCSVRKKPKTR